ncbi:AMP-dependent synthetase/ligase [Macrophomina phaseolina]|uniref:AMP-dependent synthetase/ligase n=1 Tax=Macrophomina phaseolina TaxID=35725 RepID=A0ABQ8GQX0_9PEZI|nr:AMP-dependent synthetase/ligase [Macrophomina phaseolina]
MGSLPESIGLALLDFLQYVRQNSPFYKELWRDVPETAERIEDFPIVDHTAFWEANSCLNSKVVTTKQDDGIIFKTGGTTSNPKVTFYSHAELDSVAKQLADCLVRCGVGRGDRVANLFYAGDLYGSFLLHVLSVHHHPAGAIQIPVAGHVAVESMVDYVAEFAATVVLTTVTTMCRMAETLRAQNNRTLPSVRLLLFSGEALYDDQAALLREAFPAATVTSLVYGSMDGGVIGLPLPQHHGDDDDDDADGAARRDPRVHRANEPLVRVEIISEDDGRAVAEPGVPGALVVTNLERRLMPVVRYPSGDRAEWLDVAKRVFRVLGRDGRTALRLGPVSLDFAHLRKVVAAALGAGAAMAALQAVVTRRDAKDLLTVLVAHQPRDPAAVAAAIASELDAQRPMFKEEVDKGLVNALEVRFVTMGELRVNPRTGKIQDVVDVRGVTLSQ